MKRLLTLLPTVLLCTVISAREVVTLPRVTTPPISMNSPSPWEWQDWASLRTPSMPNPPFPYKAFCAYDDRNLYIALEMELGRAPRAGQGCAIPWHSEGAEFRFALPAPNRLLQLFADASGAAFVQRNWKFQSLAPIVLRSHATETGYCLFAAFPWPSLDLTVPPFEKPINFNLLPQVQERPLRFKRDDLSLALKAGNEIVPTASQANVSRAINLNPEPRIINFGRPGYNSRELLSMLPAIFDTHPKTAIVMVGTNDVTWSKKRLPADEYEANLLRILNAFHDADVKTILVTIPPCIEEYVAEREKYTPEQRDALNDEINEFNARAKRDASKTGTIVIDYHAQFKGDLRAASSLIRNEANLRSKDGVHPSAEGYRILARLLADAIQTHNLPTSRIVCCGDSITYGAHMEGQGTTTGETYPAFLRNFLFSNPAHSIAK